MGEGGEKERMGRKKGRGERDNGRERGKWKRKRRMGEKGLRGERNEKKLERKWVGEREDGKWEDGSGEKKVE